MLSFSSRIFSVLIAKNKLKLTQIQTQRNFSKCFVHFERKLNEPISPHDLHRAGGIATFMRMPNVENHEKVDLQKFLFITFLFLNHTIYVDNHEKVGLRNKFLMCKCLNDQIYKCTSVQNAYDEQTYIQTSK
jgi:hypothetical protein